MKALYLLIGAVIYAVIYLTSMHLLLQRDAKKKKKYCIKCRSSLSLLPDNDNSFGGCDINGDSLCKRCLNEKE